MSCIDLTIQIFLKLWKKSYHIGMINYFFFQFLINSELQLQKQEIANKLNEYKFQ